MRRYLIVIEQSDTGYSAYSPDLPGCIATGLTREEVERTMRETVSFHVDGLRAEGQPLPAASSVATYVEVAA
ncbi:MAG: type II toxin-antitoxin system HicB family antitoxin [Gemmatimonadaceae bacterium]